MTVTSTFFPAAALAIAFAGTSLAATAGVPVLPSFVEGNNGPGTCQGALPAFAGTLRARPMGIRNEGTATAFVTCALDSGDAYNAKRVTRVTVSRQHTGASGFRPVSCTLVDGRNGTANFLPKSITLGPYANHTFNWVHSELPGSLGSMVMPNISCQLSPDVELNHVTHTYEWW